MFGGGLRVRTSINLRVQQDARDAIAKWLDWTGAPSAALVAMDPRDGRVLAMVGGENYRAVAVQPRGAGRAAAGLVVQAVRARDRARGGNRTGHDLRLEADHAVPRRNDRGRSHNYEGSYLGTIDLQQATIHSDNSVFGQLTKAVGPNNVVHTAHRLGIASPLRPYLSIGLGAQAVNPLEMARAFSAFANGGFRIDGSFEQIANRPRAIVAVGDKKRPRRSNAASSTSRCNTRRGRAASSARTPLRRRTRSCSASSPRERARAQRCRTARRPARRARPRTTATRGSSATRRSSSRRSGSAIRTSSCR